MVLDFFYFLRILINPKTDNEKKTKKDLITQHSFYYPENSKNGRFIGLRLMKFQITNLIGSLGKKKKLNKVDFVFYTLFSGSIKSDLSFIQFNSPILKNKESYSFQRENIFDNFSNFEIFRSILFLVSGFPFLYLFSFLKKNKFNYFLLTESYLISRVFKKINEQTECTDFFHLYPHEPDSNLSYLLSKKKETTYLKIPNMNPLFMFNENIIADKLILTLDYQQEELKAWSNNVPTENWKTNKLKPFFNENFTLNKKQSICYYSHASWLRKNEKHGSTWFNEEEMELELLAFFKENENLFDQGLDITVCLHPKEKKSEKLKNESIKYYQKIFGEDVKFFDFKKSSYDSFNEFDLGISAFTSIIFERIYCGFKSYMYHNQLSVDFPVKESKYKGFVMNNFNDVEEKIKNYKATKATDENFYADKKQYTYL